MQAPFRMGPGNEAMLVHQSSHACNYNIVKSKSSLWRLSGLVFSRCFFVTLEVIFVMKTIENE